MTHECPICKFKPFLFLSPEYGPIMVSTLPGSNCGSLVPDFLYNLLMLDSLESPNTFHINQIPKWARKIAKMHFQLYYSKLHVFKNSTFLTLLIDVVKI